MTSAPAATFSFADCVLDPDAREFRRAGHLVELEPKCFDVLVLLASNPGHTFTRDEITEQVWPGRVISDAVISRVIYLLRQATGDTSREQAVIRTVHGVGYRMAVPVSEGASESGPRPAFHPQQVLVLAAVVLVVIAAGLVWRQYTAPAPPARTVILPFVNATGQADLDWMRAGLPALLGTGLEDRSGLSLVPAEDIQHLTDGPARLDPARVEALNALFGSDLILTGEIRGEAGARELVLRVHDGARPARETVIRGDDAQALLAGSALVDLFAELPAAPVEPDESGFSDDAWINTTYARGLAAQAAGNAGEAHDLLTLASRYAPDDQSVRLRLARTELERGEPDAARSLLNTVEATLTTADRLRGEPAVSLFSLRGQLAANAAEPDRAEQFYRRALSVAERDDLPIRAAESGRRLGMLFADTGDLDAAEDWLNRSLTRFTETDYLPGRADCLHDLGIVASRRGQRDKSERFDRLALAAYEQLGRRDAVAGTRINLAVAAAARGDFATANPMLEQALAEHRALDNRRGMLAALANLSVNYGIANHLTQAAEAARELIELADASENERFSAFGRLNLGRVALTRGEPEAAIEPLADATRRFEAMGIGGQALHARGHWIDALIQSGEVASARIMLDQHLETFETADSPTVRALAERLKADMALHEGNAEAALAHLERARALAFESQSAFHINFYTARLANTLMEVDRTEDAMPWIGQLDEQDGYALTVIARYASESGDYDTAEDRMERARALLADAWLPEHEAQLAVYRQDVDLKQSRHPRK